MRAIGLVSVGLMMVTLPVTDAGAASNAWCAVYNRQGGTSENCGYATLNQCRGPGAGARGLVPAESVSWDGVWDGPHLVVWSAAPKARRVLDVGPQEHHRSLQIGAGLWRLLPLHVERDRNAIDTLARLDHVLRDLGILLEVRRLQMRLERVGILVNFE